MSVRCRVDRAAALLEDETSRRILVEAYGRSMSVSELNDRCDASKPTVYRRLEDLRECEFLHQETRIDPDGNHHPVYATNVRTVTFELSADGVEFAVDRREPMADQFTRLVEGI